MTDSLIHPPQAQPSDTFAEDVKRAWEYVNVIVVESDGYPTMYSANALRTILLNAVLEGMRIRDGSRDIADNHGSN